MSSVKINDSGVSSITGISSKYEDEIKKLNSLYNNHDVKLTSIDKRILDEVIRIGTLESNMDDLDHRIDHQTKVLYQTKHNFKNEIEDINSKFIDYIIKEANIRTSLFRLSLVIDVIEFCMIILLMILNLK